MKLIVTKEFEKPEPLVCPEAELLNVQPMTKVHSNVFFLDYDFPNHKHETSLKNTYLKGKWPNHVPGQSLVPISDLEGMFDALVLATRKYVAEELGLTGSPLQTHKPVVTVAIRETIDAIVPTLPVNVAAGFDKTVLAEAVFQRVIGDTHWAIEWAGFLTKIQNGGVLRVKCEHPGVFPSVAGGPIPSAPPDEFVQKLEEAHPEILANTETGPANQPVPCDPPSLVVEAKKVPFVDKHGNKIAAPGEGWWVGDDLCWHPPVEKKDEHPGVCSPQLPVYTTPVTPGGLKKSVAHDLLMYGSAVVDKATGKTVDPTKVAVLLGGHGKVEPGSVSDHFKVTHAPSPTDDAAAGFEIGNVWHDLSTGMLWGCADNTVGDACWVKICGADGGPVSLGPTQLKKLFIPMPIDTEHLGDPIKATYTDTGDQPDLQASFSPEAEKDLVQAMSDEVEKEMVNELMEGVLANMPTVVELEGMSDAGYMHEKVLEAIKIPPHLVAKCENSK